jgi:5-formyltetrahydrofolate cyclo-ligase
MNTNNLRFVETPPSSVEEEKKALRAYAKKRRACNENRDIKEEGLYKSFFKLFAALQAEITQRKGAGTRLNVFIYLSYSSEAPTDKLVEGLQSLGIRVFCPRMRERELQAVEYGEDFTLNALGIREPIGTPSEEEMDVVLLPLLAVDVDGNRLGYGGGYYDKYLRTHGEAVRVGYGYDFQVMGRVPHTDKDEKVDFIVTEKRILSPQRKG